MATLKVSLGEDGGSVRKQSARAKAPAIETAPVKAPVRKRQGKRT